MSDLIERLRATRDCSVCEGDGIKFNGKVCGGCQGTGRVTRFGAVGIEAADAIAAKDRELSELAAQNEWLKDRLSNLQLPAKSQQNIEEWLVECGMPTGGAYGRV